MRKHTLCLLVSVLTVVCTHVFAQKQGQEAIDSLTKELAHAKQDTNKSDLLSVLAFVECNYYPEAGLKHAREAISLSEELNWEKGVAEGYNSLGDNYLTLTKLDSALYCFNKALKLNEDAGRKLQMAQNLGNIALIYEMQSDFPVALKYLFRSLKIFEELKDETGIATQYTNIANIYNEDGNNKKAIYYNSLALSIYKKLNDPSGAALTIGNMANAYSDMGEYDKAEQLYPEAIAVFKSLGDKSGMARNMMNLSVLYESKQDYYRALDLAFESLPLHQEVGDPSYVANAYANIGGYYLDIYKDSLPIKKYSRVPATKKECLPLCVEYINKAKALDSAIGNLDQLQFEYLVLGRAYKAMGDYKVALEHYDKHYKLKDSVFSMESKVKIEHLTTEREVELKNKQIEIDRLEVAKKKNERVFFIIGIIGLLIIIFFVFRNLYLVKSSNKLLSIEKQKSEDLLLNILPSEVADELKEKGVANAKLFEDVTVLFTDFVNFTEASGKMSPQELVGELHECFKAFDDILSKYNIEKIKTVGDAYLAVAGLPTADPMHATNIVHAAMDISAFMQARMITHHESTFAVRIGINSGSVVAGIVGVKKFAYDIWGDTVNTAARMEQHGEGGKINISGSTYELVKNDFICTHRGKMTVKGKGDIEMYFVEKAIS
jgi:adenylate cyclase